MARPNKAWVEHIIYIRTCQGWLYLAVIMDLFSRKVIGWSAEPTIHRELVPNAVPIVVRRSPLSTVIYSDRVLSTAAMRGVDSAAPISLSQA